MKSDVFKNSQKKSLDIWASFVRKLVIKNFQKSPNLVTLMVWQGWVWACACTTQTTKTSLHKKVFDD